MKFLPLLFLIPLVTFAQAGEVLVGNVSVQYDERVEVASGALYYLQDNLVASEHDNNGDGSTDTWLKYNGEFVELEATDTDSDGVADVFTSVTEEGEVIGIEGEGATQYEKPEVVEFDDLVEGGSEAAAPDDLVGSLDSISIPKHGGFPWWIILLLMIGGGGYWFYKRKLNGD